MWSIDWEQESEMYDIGTKGKAHEKALIRAISFSVADDGKTVYLFVQPNDGTPMLGVTIRNGKIFAIPNGKDILGDVETELPYEILMGIFPHLKRVFNQTPSTIFEMRTQQLVLNTMQILADSLRKYNNNTDAFRADMCFLRANQMEAWIKENSK